MRFLAQSGFLLFVGWIVGMQAGWAQAPGRITGSVVAERGSRPLPGLNVVVVGTLYGAVTDSAGRFEVDPVPPGRYTVQVHALGFRPERRDVTVAAGTEAVVAFRLEPPDVELEGVETIGARRDLLPRARVDARRIREAGVHDAGALVRMPAGADAARRDALGLAPALRGLTDPQVGIYVDGARYLPGSAYGVGVPPGRVDPGFIESVEVVKGPYALTWGAGHLSALWIETRGTPPPPGEVQGVFDVGYTGNRRAFEALGIVSGATTEATYAILAAHRSGDDYRSGNGTIMPADFRDTDVRGRLGLQFAPSTRLILQAGFRDQRDLDAPGRLLDARSSLAENASARLQTASADGPFRVLDLTVYWNGLTQELSNHLKPGVPDAFRVFRDVGHRQLGGRLTTQLAPIRGVTLETGVDAYGAWYDETRGLSRDVTALPDARLTDLGAFVNATWSAGRLEASGTVRLDNVRARADVIDDSLRRAVLGGRRRVAEETFPSGALTLSTRLMPAWRLSVGVGSTARPADAVERYANGLPYPHTHRIAAVQGIPQLKPERSTQVDLWVDADYGRLDLYLGAFARRIDDYITLSPTRLNVLIPPEPTEPVIRYVNGEATFWGGEATLAYALLGGFATVHAGASYLWGRDEVLGEPVLGVAPLSGTFGGRLQAPANLFFLEGIVRWAASQDRVAASRGETSTGGYVTGDLRFGLSLPGTASLVLGLDNVPGTEYANHLNAQDPFTSIRLPEPGRTFYTRLRVIL